MVAADRYSHESHSWGSKYGWEAEDLAADEGAGEVAPGTLEASAVEVVGDKGWEQRGGFWETARARDAFHLAEALGDQLDQQDQAHWWEDEMVPGRDALAPASKGSAGAGQHAALAGGALLAGGRKGSVAGEGALLRESEPKAYSTPKSPKQAEQVPEEAAGVEEHPTEELQAHGWMQAGMLEDGHPEVLVRCLDWACRLWSVHFGVAEDAL